MPLQLVVKVEVVSIQRVLPLDRTGGSVLFKAALSIRSIFYQSAELSRS
jgi:hypothetical protein